MNNLEAEVAAIKTEIKYLKLIIPAGCGLVALLILIFWGIERNNIGERVQSALDQEGVKAAIETTNNARDYAVGAADQIKMIKETLPFYSLEVLSVNHSSGTIGKYFNFNTSSVNTITDSNEWSNKNFLIVQSRTMKIGPAVLWEEPNGGSPGDGHGRWFQGAAIDDWKAGDEIIIVSIPK